MEGEGAETELQTLASIREPLVKYADNNEMREMTKKNVSSPAGKSTQQLREILHSFLPPRNIDEQEYLVSCKPANRKDVIQLQMRLDDRLQLRQAREGGICPVREELYAQTFDELIRQITIECPERGLLLLRLRDEVKMTIAAYRTLYESSINFGLRKSLQAQLGIEVLQTKLDKMKERKDKLMDETEDLRMLLENIEKKDAEKRQASEKKRNDEIEFLEYQRQHLERFLKSSATNN